MHTADWGQRLAENAVKNTGINSKSVCDMRQFLLNTQQMCLINRKGTQPHQSQQYDGVG